MTAITVTINEETTDVFVTFNKTPDDGGTGLFECDFGAGGVAPSSVIITDNKIRMRFNDTTSAPTGMLLQDPDAITFTDATHLAPTPDTWTVPFP